MMNCLYEIYEIGRKYDLNDLIFAIARYRSENPGVIDHAKDKEIRMFIIRNANRLGKAFREGDKESFNAEVAAILAEEKAKAEAEK